jgi:hypothetical protein
MQVHGFALRVLFRPSSWLLLLVLLAVEAGVAAAPAERQAAFLAALEGTWEGQARRTKPRHNYRYTSAEIN